MEQHPGNSPGCTVRASLASVSYTHLDVYKRQMERSALAQGREPDTLTLDEMTVLWNEAKRS